MADNTLLNISMITRECLRELKNQLVFAKNANRQYDDQFAKKGAKIGSVANIRKPVRYSVTDGPALTIQDSDDQYVALTVDQRKHVGLQFSTQELTLSIDDFRQRYIAPAISALANNIDQTGLALAQTAVWNSVGTPGTQPSTAAAALALALGAGQKLDENGCPMDGNRSIILNPASQAAMVAGLSSLQNSQSQIGKQYEKGRMSDALGFNWYMGQNVKIHSSGLLGGTPAIKTTISAQGVSEVDVDGTSATVTAYWKAGDVVSFAGVYAVNPVTKESTGSLMQFVVQTTVNAATSEVQNLSFLPAMYSTGPYQNVDALPVDGAAITTFGHASTYANKTTPCNLAYHKDAFVLAMVDLELPGGVDMAARATDPESGLSIRLVRQYDINNDVMPCRLDVLYGWKAVYPELACRIQG